MWQATMSWADAKKRAALLSIIRHFFESRQVIEVETPTLSLGTVTDVHLDAFVTEYQYPVGKEKLFLQTSPEYSMKRLIASGYQSIYQISKAFRDEAFGKHHNPEFTLLEWYRVAYDHHELMLEVDALLQQTLDCGEAEKMTYQDAFLKFTGIDPLTVDRALLIEFLVSKNKADDWLIKANDVDTILQFIFCEFVESQIGKEVPCFIYDFPISQASLAIASAIDERVAHRFECYFKGIELANGFNELTLADIQISRFESDNIKRKKAGLPHRDIDQHFISALKNGLPQCSGVALGIDRLMMIALNKKDISQVLSFTIENA